MKFAFVAFVVLCIMVLAFGMSVQPASGSVADAPRCYTPGGMQVSCQSNGIGNVGGIGLLVTLVTVFGLWSADHAGDVKFSARPLASLGDRGQELVDSPAFRGRAFSATVPVVGYPAFITYNGKPWITTDVLEMELLMWCVDIAMYDVVRVDDVMPFWCAIRTKNSVYAVMCGVRNARQ